MNIRHATATDASGIAEVHVATWRDAYRGQMPDAVLDALDVSQRADFWRSVLSTEHGVFVAVRDAAVVAFCSFIASRDEDATSGAIAEIAALNVSPRHWRCGIGRKLCSQACEAATAAGFSHLTLWILASNIRAIAFYEAVGFVRDGTARNEQCSSGFVLEELRMRRAL